MPEIDTAKLADEALDAACRLIQDRLGVTTGDAAALFFSSGMVQRLLQAYAETELALKGDR